MNRHPDAFLRLCELVETLRGPSGCPWDRQQTPASIIRYLLEEAYELSDAVESGVPEAVCEESGDVLFLLLFLVHLYRQDGQCTVDLVLRTVYEKMVRRHPHVFGDAEINTTEAVRHNWTKIKQAEKKGSPPDSLLNAVPKSAPALIRAYKTAARIAGADLDPRPPDEVWSGAEKAMSSCRVALALADRKSAGAAFGEMLLRLVTAARSAGIHPETALAGALKRLDERFRRLEKKMKAAGRRLDPSKAADRNLMALCLEGDAPPQGNSDGPAQDRPFQH